MRLAAHLRRSWDGLKHGRPGRRFQDRYERAAHKRQHFAVRVLKIIGAIVTILIGLVEIVFPGPAFVFLIVGGGLLATESRGVARFMDWCEVTLRRTWHWAVTRWKRSGPGQRGALVGAVMCVAVGGVLVAWHLVFR